MKYVMCIVHCAARAALSLASELLRLIEVLVLNEVVEEGGTGQRTGGENAAARSVRAREVPWHARLTD